MAARPRITIIGTGFVGTALGLGLGRLRGPKTDYEIVGHDRDATASGAARKRGALDRVEWNLINAVEEADLVFVATPVPAIRETLTLIGPHLKDGAIVTDTGGTKSHVMRWAAESLPDRVSFIGGDPLLGREGAAAETASAEVFVRTLYCLTPAPSAEGGSVRLLADFISGLGAQPYFIDPDEHDGLVAGVSQLPFLVSTALLNAAAHSPGWGDLQRMVGEHFRQATSVVNTDPARWQGLAATNQDAVVRWLDATIAELESLRDLVRKGDSDDMQQTFDAARTTQIKLSRTPDQEENPLGDVGRDRFRQLIFGGGSSPKRRP